MAYTQLTTTTTISLTTTTRIRERTRKTFVTNMNRCYTKCTVINALYPTTIRSHDGGNERAHTERLTEEKKNTYHIHAIDTQRQNRSNRLCILGKTAKQQHSEKIRQLKGKE